MAVANDERSNRGEHGSSRGSSLMGNTSSPGSQSPSPPTSNSTGSGTDTTVHYTSSNGENSAEDNRMRRPWKKRYHEAIGANNAEVNNVSNNSTCNQDKRPRLMMKKSKTATEDLNNSDKMTNAEHEHSDCSSVSPNSEQDHDNGRGQKEMLSG